MADPAVRVDGIDHVELTVPDREAAAEWYRRTLGHTVVGGFEDWAAVDGYPLMLSSDGGHTMLALFEGSPSPEDGGFHRVAFRASGDEFVRFVDHLGDLPEIDASGPDDVADYGSAYSVYFADPFGHPYEVTSYDVDRVREYLQRTR